MGVFESVRLLIVIHNLKLTKSLINFTQPKVAVCSKYDRQTDTRGFAERRNMFKEDKPQSQPAKEDA